MTKRQLVVRVGALKDALVAFKTVWKKSARGEKIKTPIETLHFENALALMKILTPRRIELLQTLHHLGKVSIRALAKKLARDYSNVFQDVKVLSQVELVLIDAKGKYYVPWSSIITEIPLVEKNGNHHQSHKHHRHLSAHTATHA